MTESDVRKKLNAYANSTEGHPFPNLGDKVKITVLDECDFFRASLTSEYDTRTCELRQRPYNNDSVDPRTVYKPSDVDLWRLRLHVTSGFTKQEGSFVVPGSAHVETCEPCHGRGKWTCRECGGNREVTCPRCSGSRKERCPSCDGGYIRCSRCGGSGKIKTSHQESYIISQTYRPGSVVPDTKWGTRTVYKDESCPSCSNGRIRCSRCGSTGKITCSQCGGRGTIPCKRCNSTGIETCGVCRGKGRNLHFIGVDQKMYPETRSAQFFDTRLDKIQELVNPGTVLATTTLFRQKKEFLQADCYTGRENIGKKINQWIAQAREKESSSTHILFQEAVVQQVVDVWYLEYQLNRKTYYGAFADGQFYAGHSPITEYAQNLMKKADKNIGGIGTVAARDMLEKAEKLNVYGQGVDIKRLKVYIQKHLNLLYNTGIDLAFWLVVLFTTPVLFNFYKTLNPVIGYAYIANLPDWKPAEILPMVQCVIFIGALWYIRKIMKLHDHSSHRFKTVFGFLFSGIGVFLLYAIAVLAVMLVLNYFGLSIITSVIGWYAWGIIKVALTIIIFVIVLLYQAVKWLWGLFF